MRIDHDKTQQEIADVLSCKREVYRRYEKGIREIPVWAVLKLATYYHVSTDYILGLSDQKGGAYAVSYTHLDVYKRQTYACAAFSLRTRADFFLAAAFLCRMPFAAA